MMNFQLKLVRNFAAYSRKQSEKIINDKVNSNFEAFNSDLKKDVYEEYQKKIQKDSILKKFRREIFKKEQISEEMVAAEQLTQRQGKAIEKMLQQGSKEEITKYSKKIMDKLLNQKKIFRENSVETVFSDYGDYSSYKTNNLKVQDRNLSDYERMEDDKIEENYYKFIDNLPQEYAIKNQVRQRFALEHPFLSENMTISEYGKIMQEKSDAIEMEVKEKERQQGYLINQKRRIFYDPEDAYRHQWQDRPLNQLNYRGTLMNAPRLSTQALNTIYQSYLQGWTIRQISQRFGIMPARTKFIIWARAILFDELVTKHGVKYLYEAFEKEAQLQAQDGVMDYGMDIERMAAMRMPDEICEWNQDMVDAQRDEKEYSESLQIMDKTHKFNKHEKVEVGTHGKNNKMYLLKEWMIFRGKGSDQYHLRNYTYKSLTRATKKNVKEYY